MRVYAFLLSSAYLCYTEAKFTRTPFLKQSFFFDWSTSGSGTTTVAQCDSLNITWGRSTATGPNPTAPYSLSVYTSTFIVPLAVDVGTGQQFSWPVPFNPGTQFEICMFDANGNSGGCQRQVTVFPSAVKDPTCTNFTYPSGALDVAGQVDNGPISQFGWPDQCTDIQLTPKNGTPPYMMTITPSLHPPYNITVNSMDSTNWTIDLSWGSPFWISMVDSKGNGWANGPMHSGGGGTTACLALAADSEGVSSYAAVGAGIGGVILGLLVGLAGAYWLNRRSNGRPIQPYFQDNSNGNHAYHELSASTTGSRFQAAGSPYKVEPWMPPFDTPDLASSPQQEHIPLRETHSLSAGVATPIMSPGQSTVSHMSRPAETPDVSPNLSDQNHQVYVVHHDGGRAPVTVYTTGGAEVVELPPSYDGQTRPRRREDGEGSRGGTSALQPQRRMPGDIRKTRLENP